MKKGFGCITASLGLIYLPITIYGSWLVYKHIQATELMWFIWWIQIPLMAITTILSKTIEIFVEKTKEE
jgi:hypothetical protein